MDSPNRRMTREPRRAVAVVGTLMPHLAAERHHIYRGVTALALLAALIAAAFGSLSIALVLAAVALPAVVLTYIHDHNLWRDEPLTVIAVTFALSLVLGVGVGFLQTYFTPGSHWPAAFTDCPRCRGSSNWVCWCRWWRSWRCWSRRCW